MTWITIVLLLLALLTLDNAQPITIFVDDDGGADYQSIQEAIDAAQPGDVIQVAAGTYYEEITIDKTVTLKGADKQSVIHLDNETRGPRITANNVEFEGFTITFSSSGHYSLSLINVDDCIVKNCNFSNGYGGVYVQQGREAVIARNVMYNLNYGLSSVGLHGGRIQENYFIANSRGTDLGSDTRYNILFYNAFIGNVQDAYDDSSYNQWDYAGVGNYWDKYNGEDADGNGIGDSRYPVDPRIRGNFDYYPLTQEYTGVDIFPPAVEDLIASPVIQEPDGFVNISCRIIDNVEVNVTFINVSLPNGTFINESLNRIDNTSRYYYGNFFFHKGTYTYQIWANDTSNNSVTVEDIFVIAYPPTARVTYFPSDPTDLDIISFDGSNSTDPDGTLVNYTWTFGDGTTDYGETAHHRYQDDGSYKVRLTVTDNDGAWDTWEKVLSIANVPPVADFTFSPSQAIVGQTIQFTDSSSDPDGSVKAWRWDFGDGTAIPQGSTTNPTHIYETDGIYAVTLTVWDNDYATAHLTRHLQVEDIYPPVIANVTATPNPQEIQGEVNISCTITDDVAVSAAYVNVFGPATAFNASMHPGGDGRTWYYLAPYIKEGTFTFFIGATDPSHNQNRSATHTFDIIIPAKPPDIWKTDASPSPQQFGSPVNITCNVSDNVAMQTVRVNVTFPGGNYLNVSMDPVQVDSKGNGLYAYNHIYPSLGNYSYYVWVTDVNDYANRSAAATFSIIDTTPPCIDQVTVSPPIQEPGGIVNLSATVTDNLQLHTVRFTIRYPNGSMETFTPRQADSRFYVADVFPQTGVHNWTIEANDSRGNKQTCLGAFAVTRFPEANFSYSPPDPTSIQSVNFTDGSTDPDGVIINWTWDFGDGSRACDTHPRHTFSRAGTYTTTLTVRDDLGATNSTSRDIVVHNVAPVANFTFSPASPTDLDDVTFNASLSHDPDGSIVNYTWNFGDGTTGHGAVTVYNYNNDGTYTVRLTVRDDHGSQASRETLLQVANVIPVANFTYSVDDYLVSFTSTSLDRDGTIASYVWDFGDSNISYDRNPFNLYGSQGAYEVTLTVTDNDGATDTTSRTLTIGEAPSNQAPNADFTYTPTTPTTQDTITFTDQSTDSDGTLTSHAWNFGDGTTSTTPNPTHQYTTPGTYTVTLTITDNDGATDTTSQNINIVGDWNPWDDDGVITTNELQEIINHWLNDIPKNGHYITTPELQALIALWLTS
ncbi:MAG: PKD domain-containing protein [Candidatus Thermoplasmatota archaeon]|nr:PKD domain-containing protein [Candidatus Thermoplasmatota archaeon]